MSLCVCRENEVGSWTWLVSVTIGLFHLAGDLWDATHTKGPVDTADLTLRAAGEVADAQLAIYFCFPNSTWSNRAIGWFGITNAVCGFLRMLRREWRAAT